MQFRSMTGGFVLLQIMKSEPLRLEFLVKERVSETRAIGKFDVKPGDPAMVASFGLRALHSGFITLAAGNVPSRRLQAPPDA